VSSPTENTQEALAEGLEPDTTQPTESAPDPTAPTPSTRWWAIALLAILLLAATLRLVKLDQSPPGMQVDEAGNTWNAYCLLKTGLDANGVRWPILYTKGFGFNVTTLFIYTLIPFQAIGGMNVYTTRLPGALGGVLTVWLLYYIGKRLFGRWVGLVAAGLLAINPWHLLESRWGHESTLVPLLVTAPVAALLWAGLPLGDEETMPRPWRAALAGALAGIACYGYPSVRIFLPVFLIALVLVNWRAWLRLTKTREGLLAVGALVIAGLVTFGPLLWAHLTDPEINKRGATTRVWNETDSAGTKMIKALSRYPAHFGPDFLFLNGDPDISFSLPPGVGVFHWYDALFMLAGLATLVWHCRSSRASRFLLLWVLLYPVGDLLSAHPTAHMLRSLPGVCALVLLAAVGAVQLGRQLWQWNRVGALALGSVLLLLVLWLNASFLGYFYTDYNRQTNKQFMFYTDLLEACAWLKPRFPQADAIYVSGNYMTHPYIYTLVGLEYDPRQWFKDQPVMESGQGFLKHETICKRYGKMHFILDNASRPNLDELRQNGKDDHVIFILRTGDLQMERLAQPVYQIRNSQGKVTLNIFDLHL
jgi:4-amino-4-deoxy-L-arabinose transferase-like glycosyltransferase